jgi:biopolymer transport protein ExbD
MDIKEEMENAEEGLPIGPLIDVVFLLLIYFIATSSLNKPEGDLGIKLPGAVSQSTQLNMPDEQIIEINASGGVNLNNKLFSEDNPAGMDELVQILRNYKQASELSGNKAMITIQADDETSHQRVIDVMSACGEAGIVHMSVGMGQ